MCEVQPQGKVPLLKVETEENVVFLKWVDKIAEHPCFSMFKKERSNVFDLFV